LDINSEDEISYTTHYQDAFLNYVANQYYANHRYVAVNILKTVPSSKLVPHATSSRSC
jgi:hypothetical protein